MKLAHSLTPILALFTGLAAAGGDCFKALPPSRDAWYTLPKGANCSGSPGKVLRFREAPRSTRESLSGIRNAWNILFCSTNSLGEPSFSVTTVLVPDGADPKALLTYAPAYDSINLDSSPSYAFNNLVDASIEQAIFAPLLVSKRWILNVPDYEGPRAAYLAGNNTGHGMLDSIRAVQSLCDQIGLAAEFEQAVYGYSGGGFAAEWAAQLQPSYAPELKIGVFAFGGLAVNITRSLFGVNGGASAGLAVIGLLGVTVQFPDARKILVDNLHKTGPYNATTFFSAEKLDAKAAEALFKNQDISRYFIRGFSFFDQPAFARAFKGDTEAGHADTPTTPLYVYHAVNDEISPIQDVDDLLNKYCAAGAHVEYRRNTVGSHTENAIAEGIRALNWLGDFFKATQKPIEGCSTQNVSTPLGSDSLALLFIVFAKQGYNISHFLQVHPLPNVPSIPSGSSNKEVFSALHLSTRLALDKIGVTEDVLANFYVTDQDLAKLGIQ